MRFVLFLTALLLPSVAAAEADLHDAMTPPQQVEDVGTIETEWTEDPQGWVSEERPGNGTRVGVLLTAEPWAELALEAEVDGSWLPAHLAWSGGDDQRIYVVDFDGLVADARVRISTLDGLVDLAWKLFEPAGEARRLPGGNAGRSPVLTQALRDIGVIAREDWGAVSSECTATEDDWYRFAIHHTAGNQTSGGTVEGAIQATQAWTMGGGGFCDIPYQFLVGFDGSLWEGRALNLRSGATGGGNNDGNIAVSFMGCYDQPGCSGGGQPAGLRMIAAARLLVQTLSAEHFITPTEDTLRGHRQWPGNSTACPGDRVLPRLPELRSPSAHFEADLVAMAWDGVVQIEEGDVAAGWVDLANVGLEVWGQGTRLAPLPRDAGSPLADTSWIAPNRVSEPTEDTSPGETARFPLRIFGAEVGTHTLTLTLVEESVTWFEDIPIGGGIRSGDVVITVDVVPVELPGDDDDAADDDDDAVDDDDDDALGGAPFLPDSERRDFAAERVACACSTGAAPAGGLLVVPLLGFLRRRR